MATRREFLERSRAAERALLLVAGAKDPALVEAQRIWDDRLAAVEDDAPADPLASSALAELIATLERLTDRDAAAEWLDLLPRNALALMDVGYCR